MGEIIVRKVKGMNWKAKISLVLIFAMVFSTFMYQGWYKPRPTEAAITYQSAGALAYSAAGGSSVAPAYPASIALGDLLVLIVGMKPGTANTGDVTTPTGWTPVVSLTGAGGYGTTLGADTGNTNLFTYYTVAQGTESGSLSVTINVNGANGVAWAQIFRYSKTTGEWSVAGATGSDTTGDATVSIAFGSNPGVTVNDHILGAMCIPTDVTTPAQFSAEAFTQTGATFAAATELSEPDSTTGNDIGGFVARSNVTAGTGTANPTMTATAGGTTTNVRGPGVFIRIREATGTPPIAGTVTVSPDNNGFTSSAPTITTTFTDNESPIQSCEYTTNGSTWTAGTLSGSGATRTCTATPTGLSGSLTINMRATSGGGPGTATQLTPRTVDTAGPTDGTLNAIAGNAQVGLEWTIATDAGIGLASANTYKVVKATGATPPANCSGAAIYQGTARSYADSAVTNLTQYAYRVCAYDTAGNVSTGVTVTATPSVRTGKIASCGQCHAHPPLDGTARNTPAGAVIGDHQKHDYVCSTCHVAPATETSADFEHRNGNIEMQPGASGISGGYYDKNANAAYDAGVDNTFAQTNTPTTASCRNITCHGGNNPTPQWGIGTANCVTCHNGTITRTKGVPGGTLSNVVTEFNNPWGHKPTGKTPARPSVAAADCIVCHLEGNYTTQATSSYHADGNIDLRNPDGVGEVPITNISGGAFNFTKFSVSYGAGSRTSSGHLSDTDIANVITQKFCLACHDNNGATNTTARSNNGGTGTANMPFGGFNLGANYTTANGAVAAGGLIDVKTQVGATSQSKHPILAPRSAGYPTTALMFAPYNNFTRTAGTLANSVVLNCFDCHNTPTTPLTDRTVVAHGSSATNHLRGVAATNVVASSLNATTATTLCKVCHDPTTSGQDSHKVGSGFGDNSGQQPMRTFLEFGCNICHGASYDTIAARPVLAQDSHGYPNTASGPVTTKRAFIRGNTAEGYVTAWSIGSCTGMAGNTAVCGSQRTETYTPGGVY